MVGSPSASENARIDSLLAVTAHCESLSDWLAATLQGLEERFQFGHSWLMLVLVAARKSVARAFAGASRGWDRDVLAEYFDRWVDSDPLAGEAAHEMFESRGFASIAELYPVLTRPERRFVDEFLRSIEVADQLSLRLPGNGTTDGYLTIHEPSVIDGARVATVLALAPRLSAQLRMYLPRGIPGALALRARQVAELTALGFSNREIAAVLSIGEDTVKKHLYRAMHELGIERRTQFAVSWTTGRILALRAAQGARPPADIGG